MKIREEAIEDLQRMRSVQKFDEDESILYPGLADESIRDSLTDSVNRAVDDFIAVVQRNGNEKDFRQAISNGLTYFDEGLDTEERERICGYFEEMMNAVGLESSEGILNRWLYGFDIE